MNKHLIIILLIVTTCAKVLAQGVDEPDIRKRMSDRKTVDSLGYGTIKPEIKSWVLTNNYSRKDSILVDTLIDELNNFNPIYQRSISNAYLGNMGSPYRSNIFIDRKYQSEFFFLKNYEAYLKRPDSKDLFFDTKTPFTKLSYDNGGAKGREENLLRVLHTQNISPNWNFAINYNLISSDGQYMAQKTKIYDITFSSRYEKDRYGLYFLLNKNKISTQENGGIVDDSFVRDTSMDAENIQVNLNDSWNNLSNFNFFINHRYGLGEGYELINNKDTLMRYPTQVVYSFEYESDEHKFEESAFNPDFYQNSFFNDTETFDKTEFNSLKNSVQLVFNENKNKWIRLGARFMLGNQILKHTGLFYESAVVLGQKERKYHNNFLLANFYSQSGSFFNWNASAFYYFEGYRQHDVKLAYELTKWLDKGEKNHGFSVFTNLESKTPDILLTEYNSNHQQWSNNFDAVKELELGFSYFNKTRNFVFTGQVNQINDYVYFNSIAMPQQTGKGIRVITAFLQKNLVFGNFHLQQKVVGQNSSHEKVIPLPTISVYSNNYYKNTFFKGALDIETGFVMHYNSEFYAPNYMPSIGQFFVQNTQELGNYPKFDLYFNFRIKRTRFFLMYEHLNAKMGSRNYFTTLHYPLNPSIFKYGLIWTFYN